MTTAGSLPYNLYLSSLDGILSFPFSSHPPPTLPSPCPRSSRFPASFTFVLRAFSTLEGIGKTLNPDYKFSDVAQPYAQELLELQDGQKQRDMLISQVTSEIPVDSRLLHSPT